MQEHPFADCPRCSVPLRFIASENCADSTGGGVYHCSACRYSTARDLLVARLLGELRDTRDLFERYARLSLPGFVHELVGRDHRCPDCEKRWREALVAALDRADARQP